MEVNDGGSQFEPRLREIAASTERLLEHLVDFGGDGVQTLLRKESSGSKNQKNKASV